MTGGEPGATAPLRLPATNPDVATKRHLRGSSRISMRQATNIIEAVRFARMIDLPLVAHLTIHWSLTDVGDDPNGALFANFHEKCLDRRGIVFAGAWARECQCRGQSDVEHCHLLFHLPVKYQSGKLLAQVKDAILRLVRLHGGEVTDERAIDLAIWPDPDGKYLVEGGGPKIWTNFRLRKEHRRLQGTIHGKRSGTTENIGPAARGRDKWMAWHVVFHFPHGAA